MQEVNDTFLAALRAQPEIGSAFSVFDASFPQFLLHVDSDRAAKNGVSVEAAMSTLQTLIGGEYAANFIRFGQMYKVMVQALPQHRAEPDDVLRLFVKNDNGEMVPFSAFMHLEKVYGLEQVTRYNMYPSAEINGEPASGYTSGDALAALRRVADKELPRGFEIAWAGMTLDEVQAGNTVFIVFGICLVFVYLLMVAQYESFVLPFVVLLSLPVGAFGAFGGLWLAGLENNIYAQISVVMLIGLLGKNAILIVEYAVAEQAKGVDARSAAIQGAVLRVRPILMTSFAFIAGLLPLVFASGAGAMGNRTVGTAAASGMLVGTVLGLLTTPGIYASIGPKRRGESVPEQTSRLTEGSVS
jgi:HAE1 family hydrophobic/amphiphilic exporter-1